jgi:hypothetical protein
LTWGWVLAGVMGGVRSGRADERPVSWAAPVDAESDAEALAPWRELPATLDLTHERLSFASPRTAGAVDTPGLSSIGLAIDLSPHFSLGANFFGATTGSYGGFINLGVQAGLRFHLLDSWVFRPRLFVGGGGGSSAPTGGGLMLRPSAALGWEFRRFTLEAGYSWVRFPSGAINSRQAFVGVSLPTDLPLVGSATEGAYASPRASLASGRLWLAPGFRVYPRDQRIFIHGRPMGSSVGLVGFGLTKFLDPGAWFFAGEVYGALQGHAAGYMSVDAGMGYAWPATSWLTVAPSAQAGFAGGGGVDIRAGLAFHPNVAWLWAVDPQNAIRLQTGYLVATTGTLRTPTLTVGWNHDLRYLKRASGERSSAETAELLDRVTVRKLRIGLASQRYFLRRGREASASPRTDADLFSLDVDYFPTAAWFVGGSSGWAYSGRSGAYATGLLGVGYRQGLLSNFYLEAKLEAGCAGGGGIPAGHGLLAQLKGGGGWGVTSAVDVFANYVRVSFPRTAAFHSAELGVRYRFGLPTVRRGRY